MKWFQTRRRMNSKVGSARRAAVWGRNIIFCRVSRESETCMDGLGRGTPEWRSKGAENPQVLFSMGRRNLQVRDMRRRRNLQARVLMGRRKTSKCGIKWGGKNQVRVRGAGKPPGARSTGGPHLIIQANKEIGIFKLFLNNLDLSCGGWLYKLNGPSHLLNRRGRNIDWRLTCTGWKSTLTSPVWATSKKVSHQIPGQPRKWVIRYPASQESESSVTSSQESESSVTQPAEKVSHQLPSQPRKWVISYPASQESES